jgi:hypothetical protein
MQFGAVFVSGGSTEFETKRHAIGSYDRPHHLDAEKREHDAEIKGRVWALYSAVI